MMRFLPALLLLLAALPPAQAADAPAARVLTPPPAPAPPPAFDEQAFRAQYARAGNPGIALFWNREVSDALSQWQAASRSVVERRLSGRSADPSAEIADDFDCSFTWRSTEAGDCRSTDYEFTERNIGTDEGQGTTQFATRRDEFEFGAALTQALLAQGVAVVDRNLVMRLTQAEQQQAPLAPAAADYYQVELQALAGYADYVAEVLLADSVAAGEDPLFMVNIKEIASGRLVGMFTSRAPQAAGSVRWATGPNGYERVQQEGLVDVTPAAIGQAVGEQTLETLAAYWARN